MRLALSASLHSLLTLAIGFAFAALLCSGYQLFAARPASLRLIQHGPSFEALAAVPFLTFAAPFLIVRDVMFADALRSPSAVQRFEVAMLAGVATGVWSLMSGTVFLMALGALLGFAL
jgi:hypothetical protein